MKNPTYTKALSAGMELFNSNEELELRSALKQGASDCGIPYGEEMGAFVAWAENFLNENRSPEPPSTVGVECMKKTRFVVKQNGKYWSGQGKKFGFYAAGLAGAYSFPLNVCAELAKDKGGEVVGSEAAGNFTYREVPLTDEERAIVAAVMG